MAVQEVKEEYTEIVARNWEELIDSIREISDRDFASLDFATGNVRKSLVPHGGFSADALKIKLYFRGE